MTCGTCTRWELKGSPMRAAGMGLCTREEGVFRQARAFSPTATCNKQLFEQASTATLAARTKALKGIP